MSLLGHDHVWGDCTGGTTTNEHEVFSVNEFLLDPWFFTIFVYKPPFQKTRLIFARGRTWVGGEKHTFVPFYARFPQVSPTQENRDPN